MKSALLAFLLASPLLAQEFHRGEVIVTTVGYACGPPGDYEDVSAYAPDTSYSRTLHLKEGSYPVRGPVSLRYQGESGTIVCVTPNFVSIDSIFSTLTSLGANGEIKALPLRPVQVGWSNSPSALAPDAEGGMYVLWWVQYPVHGKVIELRHFDRTGAQISPAIPLADDSQYVPAMDVAADDCTILYSHSSTVARYDACRGVAFPPIAVPSSASIRSIRVLPDGGTLVALAVPIVLRFDASGALVREYRFDGLQHARILDAIALDSEGLSFYATFDEPCWYTGTLVRVDLESGAMLGGPSPLASNEAIGMTVVGEWRANDRHVEVPRRRAAR